MMGRSLSLMELGRLEEQVAPTRRSHLLSIGSSRIGQPGERANAGNPVAQAGRDRNDRNPCRHWVQRNVDERSRE